MDIITGILFFLLAALGLRFIPFFKTIPALTFKVILFFFTLKVLSGTLLIFIYTYYYDIATADFYKYYSDGRIMYEAIYANPLDYLRMLTGISASAPHLDVYYKEMVSWSRPWEAPVFNDSRVVIRFNALVSLFSFGSIHVHTVVINFLSMFGLVAIYKFALKYTPQIKHKWLPWGIFLFPSLLFWGSGILTEGFLILGFGLWLYLIDKMVTEKKLEPKYIILLIVSLFFLIKLKPYNLLLLIPCQLAFYIGMRNNVWSKQLKYGLILALWVFLGVLAGYILPQYDVISILSRKQNDFVNFSVYVDAGSLIHTRLLQPNLWDMFLSFPRGFWHVLTRPHIFEVHSLVVLMAALENLFVAGLIIFAIFRFDKKGLNMSVVWLSVWFAILLMGFVGLITPLHGAFVRYKIMALPFMWIIFVNLAKMPDYSYRYKKKHDVYQ